ncbi:MAG: substrate-binding domain-containing protein [Clostridia bacterium]|nr:substrate-binding domain-containing protein [Clostridia bacterium]
MSEQQELEELMLRQEVKNLMQQAARRSNTISLPNGCLVVMLVVKEHVINFVFWNTILDMIESEVKRLGYTFQMHVVDDSKDEWLRPEATGYILLGRLPQQCFTQVEALKKPIVWVDCENEFGNYGQVRVNNRCGTYMLTKRAIELGHRRLAFCGGSAHRSYEERGEGMMSCVREYSALGVTCEVISNRGNPAETKRMLVELLTRRNAPTFIQCASDSGAQAVYAAAKSLMLKIPDDLSIAGFDNIKEAHLMEPPLTTVGVPRMDMAITAVELLVKQMNAPLAANEVILLEPEMVLRESMAAPGGKR